MNRRELLGCVAGVSVVALFPAAAPASASPLGAPQADKLAAVLSAPWKVVLNTSIGKLEFPLPLPAPAKNGEIVIPRFDVYAERPFVLYDASVVAPGLSFPVDGLRNVYANRGDCVQLEPASIALAS